MIFNIFILYLYNIISSDFNFIIPINFFTVGIVCILGIPGMFLMILFKIFVLWGDEYE